MGTKHKEIKIIKSIWLGLLLLASSINAQTTITGKVSSDKTPIQGARVSLQKAGSASFLAYTFTNEKGYYKLETAEKGELQLNTNAINYSPTQQNILISDKNISLDIDIKEGGVKEIKEVIVYNNPKLRIKKDTIELNAKAYANGDERTVEDLLKRIPGLNVEKDGTIKIGNKEVEKVMVENDDLFEKGYKLLTQNMSVKPIEKIQVLQRYSNNKHLKGIENSDKVALNLTLKDDAKSVFFGDANVEGSIFPKNIYNLSANLMNFGKKNKFFLLGKANNDGVDAVSAINSLIYSNQGDDVGNIGDNVRTPTILDNTPNLSNFDYTRTNFNNDKLLSLNTIFNPTSKLKIKLLGFMNFTTKNYFRNSSSIFTTPNESFTNTEDYVFKKSIENYFGKWEFSYDLNKKQTINYVGNLGNLKQNDLGNLTFNNDPSSEITTKNQALTNHKITYTNRIAENTVWVTTLRYISQKSPVDYNINKYYYEDIFHETGINAFAEQIKNELNYVGVKSEIVHKTQDGNVIQFAGYYERLENIFKSKLFLEKSQTEIISPDGFLNDVNSVSQNVGLSSKYTLKLKKVDLIPEIDVKWASNNFENSNASKMTNFLLINPRFYTKWNVHKKGQLMATFSYQNSLTELMDMLPAYYNDGLRSFNKGISGMQALKSLSSSLSYTLGTWTDRLYINLDIGLMKDFDYLSPNIYIQPNYSLSENKILKDRSNTYFRSQINYFLKFINSNLKINLSTSESQFQNILNDELRDVKTQNFGYGFELRSVWRFMLNINLGTNFNEVKYQSSIKNSVLNNHSFFQLYFKFSKNLYANYKNEMYYFGDQQINGRKSYYFGDFGLNWKLEKYKVDLSLTGKNLYNTNIFRNMSITDYYSSVTEYKLLSRYLMFGINFSF